MSHPVGKDTDCQVFSPHPGKGLGNTDTHDQSTSKKISHCAVLSRKWNTYVITPPLKAPGTLWKRGQKDCQSQKSRLGATVSSEHGRNAALTNPLQLMVPAPDLHKTKPVNAPAGMARAHQVLTLLEELLTSWLVLGNGRVSFLYKYRLTTLQWVPYAHGCPMLMFIWTVNQTQWVIEKNKQGHESGRGMWKDLGGVGGKRVGEKYD